MLFEGWGPQMYLSLGMPLVSCFKKCPALPKDAGLSTTEIQVLCIPMKWASFLWDVSADCPGPAASRDYGMVMFVMVTTPRPTFSNQEAKVSLSA